MSFRVFGTVVTLIVLLPTLVLAENFFGYEYVPVGNATLSPLADKVQVEITGDSGDDGVRIDPGTALSASLTITQRSGRFNTIQSTFILDDGGTLTQRVVNEENPLAVDGLEWVESAAQGADKGGPVSLATRVDVKRDGVVVYSETYPAGWNTPMVRFPIEEVLTRTVRVVPNDEGGATGRASHDAAMATVRNIRIAPPGGGEDIEVAADVVTFVSLSDGFSGVSGIDDICNFGEVGDTVQFNPLAAGGFADGFQASAEGGATLLCDADWPNGSVTVTSANGSPSQVVRLSGTPQPGIAVALGGSGSIAATGRPVTLSGRRTDTLSLVPVTFDANAQGIANLFLDPSAVADVGAVEVVAYLGENTVAVVPFASVPDFLASGVDTASGVVAGYQVDNPSGAKIETALVADDVLLYLEFATSNIAIAGGQPVTADRIKVRCPGGACRPSKAIPPSIKGVEISAPTTGLTITDIETYGEGDTGDDLGLDPIDGGFVEAGSNVCIEVPNALATGIQWDRNGTAIPFSNSRRLCIANIQPADSGTYTATFDDGSGKALATYSVTLTVVAALPTTNVSVLVVVMLALGCFLLVAHMRRARNS